MEQRELKASLLLESMATLGLDALTVGEGDLAFGVDFLTEGAKQHGLPYVSANLRRTDGSELFPAFRVVERPGLRIGILGVTGPRFTAKGVKAEPVEASVRAVVERLRSSEKVDLVVLLSHQGLQADQQLAEAVPGIDLIFSGHDRRFQVEPLVVGETALFEAGSRGKYLGQVDLELFEDRSGWADDTGRTKALRRKAAMERQVTRYEGQLVGEADERRRRRAESALRRVRQQLAELSIPPADDGTRNKASGRQVPMGRDIGDEPKMAAVVAATLDKLGETISTNPDDHGHGHDHSHGHDHGHGHDHSSHSGRSVAESPFVGAGVCMGCHPSQYSDWASTPHAHAWKTLVEERRHFDQDCWSCHVTGAGQPGGPSHPKEVGSMQNVQCEACHGPGRKHVSAPTQVDMMKSPPEALCITCHTMEQTEGRFVYETYLPKVDHRP